MKVFFTFCLLLASCLLAAQTSTETFETESHGSTSFTDNGQVFNITSQSGGPFRIQANYPGTGWNGTAVDNRYIDNSNSASTGSGGVQFTISAAGGAVFQLKKMWLFLSTVNLNLNVSGTCTITGKQAGVTKFTVTQSSGFTTSIANYNGYTLIDLSTYGGTNNSGIGIDEFVVTTTGNFEYVCLDAMTWQSGSCPTVTVTAVSSTNVSCNGGSNGAATVSASGGSGFIYNWTPGNPTGDGTPAISAVPAGTWVCTVTNSCGQSGSASFTITEPPALTYTSGLKNDPICNGSSSGSATITVSGGTPPYTYTWAPSGGTAATATGLSAGTYTCTYIDSKGCMGSRSFTLNDPPLLTVSTSQTNANCIGSATGSATVIPSGGTPPYSYIWTPSGGTAATASGLTPGNHSCLITDANGCTNTKTFTILENQATLITAGTSVQNVTCNGGNDGKATILLNGGTPPYTYNWAPSGGSSATASGLTAGTYICTYRDANGCGSSSSISITEPPAINSTAVTVPVNGTYSTGNHLDITTTFSEVVNVTGNPSILITLNTGTVSAAYLSGSGSKTLIFRYTIVSGDQDPDGINIANSIQLNGGSIQNAAGCNAKISISGTPSTAGVLVKTQVAQTITFSTFSNKTYGDADFAPGASTSSGLAISYTSSNTNVATIAGNNIHITGAGTTTITASQAGNADYLPASVQQVLTVAPKPITVTATALSKTYGQADPVLTYTLNPALINGDILSGALSRVAGENAGTYSIQQGNLANNNYAITFVPALFTINKAAQLITWSQVLTAGCDGNTTIQLTATASSGLPVTFTSSNTAIATINNNVLTIVGPGTVTMTATQPGNNNYNAAAQVTRELISKLPPGIITQHWNDALFFDNSSRQYTAWQWYKNGAPVNGATAQYYYENGDLNGIYYAEAKTTAGTTLQTCPVTVTPGARVNLISVYPNPASRKQIVTVKLNYPATALQGAVLTVSDIQGVVLQTIQPVTPQMNIRMPQTQGIYVIRIRLSNGNSISANAVVR